MHERISPLAASAFYTITAVTNVIYACRNGLGYSFNFLRSAYTHNFETYNINVRITITLIQMFLRNASLQK
jgi:hypothetical protein